MTGKPRGGDGDGGSGDGGNVPRQRGRSGGVPANVARAQDDVGEVARRGRQGGGGQSSGTGSGSGRGRQSFRGGDDVPGPARGRELRMPHPRHTVSGARSGAVKDPSTVYLRGYENVARDDVAQIAAGNATWDTERQQYHVNGRSYGVESSGTVFPVSGEGMAKLTGNEYAALKEIAKAGGDLSQAQQLTMHPRFVNNPDAVAKAKEIYDGTYEP
ncbi:hypothetical protein [Plantactinospora sp. CA-290183]|uniref:hypothetical protein n=1 Tax=Plantactinospora sp. CA-290183 TaxID=3240006 RepID=UPI003D94F33A